MKKLLSLAVVMLLTFMVFTVAGFAAVPEDMDFHKAAVSVDETVSAAIADMFKVEAAALLDFKSLEGGNLKPIIYDLMTFEDPGPLLQTYQRPGKHATACDMIRAMGVKIDTNITDTHDGAERWQVVTWITGKGVVGVDGFTEPVGVLST